MLAQLAMLSQLDKEVINLFIKQKIFIYFINNIIIKKIIIIIIIFYKTLRRVTKAKIKNKIINAITNPIIIIIKKIYLIN